MLPLSPGTDTCSDPSNHTLESLHARIQRYCQEDLETETGVGRLVGHDGNLKRCCALLLPKRKLKLLPVL